MDHRTTINLHLRAGAIASLGMVEEQDRVGVWASFTLGTVTVFTTPRDMRLIADSLVAAADEACRREDELTDAAMAVGF